MQGRGASVDRLSINRWAVRLLPSLETMLRWHKLPVNTNWRVGECAIKVEGVWQCLCRAVDREGTTVAFLPMARRDEHRFVERMSQPMLDFMSRRVALRVLPGIALMHMNRKCRVLLKDGHIKSFADQFYALAGKIRPV